jgi:hypothetical protein
MKRQIASFVLVGAGLLGGCATDVDSALGDDEESGDPSSVEQDALPDGELASRQQAIWYRGCTSDQESALTSATFFAYFYLKFALQAYVTDGERENHFFGVGYSDIDVQSTLVNMWGVMNDQDLTIICAPLSSPTCTRPDGKLIWAAVTPEDVNNGISRISVCPRFFDPDWTPAQEDRVFASPPGLLLHEMAHLAGAWSDDYMGYDRVRELANLIPFASYINADSFHYYIFNNRWN